MKQYKRLGDFSSVFLEEIHHEEILLNCYQRIKPNELPKIHKTQCQSI